MIRFGFIGFGKFAQIRKKCLEQHSTVQLTGFYDPYFKGAHPLKRFSSVNECIEGSDALIVSVPPKLAPDFVANALHSDKKVFCEKPAATSVADLLQVEKALKPTSTLAYGFNHRQHSSIRKMHEIINSKKLGRILWMRGRYGKEVDKNYKNTWRCDPYLNGGGILIDQGIHLVDLMNYLADGFDGAQSVLSNSYLNIEGVDDNGFVNLFSSKTKIAASIHSTVTQWRYLFSLEIFLEKGSLILNGLRTNSGNYGEEKLTVKPNALHEDIMDPFEIIYPTNTSWQVEMNSFIKAIQDGSKYPLANYDDALKTTTLMELIYREAIWL